MCSGRYVPGNSTTFGRGKIGNLVGNSPSVSLMRTRLYCARPPREPVISSDALDDARARALDRLRRHAVVLSRAFDLPLRSVDAESPRVRRRYGICYADGRIRIRLHQVRAPDLLKYSVMVDTLCHELAHLRHLNHGQRFWRLYRRILAYAPT